MSNSTQYNKEYYKKNKEKLLLKNNNWNNNNKDKVLLNNKKWALNNPEKFKKSNIKKSYKYNHNLRLLILGKLGNKCLHCGFKDYRALQIDHVNGGGKKEINSQSSRSAYYKLVLASVENNENKYQLLCANCNWIKRFENKE